MTHRSSTRLCLTAASLLFLLVRAVSAQTADTGAVIGTVTDSSGAVVPGADVEIAREATNEARRFITNDAGQYNFPSLLPGAYRITVRHAGFTAAAVAVEVAVGKSVLADIVLKVGSATEIVEVVESGRTELQTIDAAVGNMVTSSELTRLPTVQRNALELVNMGVGTVPATGTSGQYYGRGSSVAGSRGDQNTVTVDGVDTTDRYTSASRGISSIDLPVDAIEEFRSTTVNPNALTGSSSSGGYFTFTTRRGTNEIHGSAYWYHQNDNLNANTWTRNRLGQRNPELKDNRLGARLGGPLIKNRTFLFGFYEARRFPQSADGVRIVPTDSFRQGILRFRDAAGNVVNYDLRASTLCGPSNSNSCDPRGIGISPLVRSYLNNVYPAGNDPTIGDGLNTIGFRSPADISTTVDTAVARLDHNFSSTWRLNGSYIFQRQRLRDTTQLEFDKTVVNGGLKSLSGTPRDPRNIAISVTGQLSPMLMNEVRLGWNRQDYATSSSLPRQQIAGAGTPLDLGSTLLDDPGDPNADRARPQFIKQRNWSFGDNVNWVAGQHILQFGFVSERRTFLNARPDRLPFNTVPVAQIRAGQFITVAATDRPPTCAANQANCLRTADVTNWNTLYGTLLGMWDNTQVLTIRNGQGRPTGEFFATNDSLSWHHELRAMDTWRVNQSLTINYGLNVTISTPWADRQNREFFIADTAGNLIHPKDLIRQKAAAADQGKPLNPTIEYLPRSSVHRAMYPTSTQAGPRAGAAWNPSFQGGLLGKLFGDRKTVLRGGYSLVFDRILATGVITSQISSNEILNSSSSIQRPTCDLLGSPGPGCIVGQSPFRLGVDGSVIAPAPKPTVTVPYVPAARATGQSFGVTAARAIDPDLSPGYVHGVDFTLQRELPANMVMEMGWIGRYGRNLMSSFNLNAAPINLRDMSGKSSQTFAQAFDSIATELRRGVPAAQVTPQPWFDNVFGTNGTRTIAAAGSAGFINGRLSDLFLNTIDPRLLGLGVPTVLNQQFDRMSWISSGSWSNYNALFFSVEKRFSKGLQLNANYTWAHGLDTSSNTADANASAWSTPFNPGFDYADSLSDLRHVFKLYGFYELPSLKKSRLFSGWYTSFIYIARSGFPVPVTQGGDVFGSPAIFGSTTESVPGVKSLPAGGGLHEGVAGSRGVGTSGNPATRGTGLNLFADPAVVFNSLRPFLLSQDTRSARGSIRGLGFWNLDTSLGKSTAITERVKMTFAADFFNIFNHPGFADPSLSLLSSTSFGVISSQLTGNASRGDFAGPRRIQFGLRFDF